MVKFILPSSDVTENTNISPPTNITMADEESIQSDVNNIPDIETDSKTAGFKLPEKTPEQEALGLKKEEQKRDLNSIASLLGLPLTDLKTGGEEFKAALQERQATIPSLIKTITNAIGSGIKEGSGAVADVGIYAGKRTGEFIGQSAADFKIQSEIDKSFDFQKKLIESSNSPSKELDLMTLEQERSKAKAGALGVVTDDDAKEILADLLNIGLQVGTAVIGEGVLGAAGKATKNLAPVARYLARIGISATEGASLGFTEESLRVIASGGTKEEAIKAGMSGALWGAIFGGVAGGIPSRKIKGTSITDIAETITPKQVSKAAKETFNDGRFRNKGFWKGVFGGNRAVEPSQRDFDIASTIIENIDNPAIDDIQELNKQVQAAGQRFKGELSSELKKIPIDEIKGEKLVTELSSLEDELSEVLKDVTNTNKKEFRKAIDSMLSAENLDDAYNVRIDWDKQFPENIKKGNGLVGADIEKHKLWKDTRNKMNDIIETLSEGTPAEFKKNTSIMHDFLEASQALLTHASDYRQIRGFVAKGTQQAIKTGATLALLSGAFRGSGIRLARAN